MADDALPSWRPGDLRGLALALLGSLIVLQLPFGGLVLYPFKVLNTWMHEISHGLLMMVTGVGFDRMDVYRDGSGLAFPRGQADGAGEAAIAAAGYMGTPLWGVVLLWLGRDARRARWALGAVGALVGATALAFLENRFGQVTLGATAAVVIVAALLLPARGAMILCNLIAAQACIGALVDIRVLYRPVLVVDGQERGSDAGQMASVCDFGLSTPHAIWLWATIWLVWSMLLLFIAIRLASKSGSGSPSRMGVSGELSRLP